MRRRGFTLVELAIVIAILGILALYAIPKYQGMVEEARSAQARAQLGSVRSALGIYYAKNHGVFPATLDGTLFAEGQVPEVEITVNGTPVRSNAVATGNGDGVVDPATEITNAGGYVYDVKSDFTQADVRLNSSDIDPVTTTKHWYEY